MSPLLIPVFGMALAGFIVWLSLRHKQKMTELKGGNAEMRQQLSDLTEQNKRLGERLAVVEKLVTDSSYDLDRKIRELS